ncbi:LOW QUALITY PROTEIN: tRNA-dihydrouridine(20a/20b) synthase [NAD(P)+]-like [Lampetra planeri]
MAERRMSAVELLQSGRMVRVSAPMVRYSKLAFRSLVRRYGCDLCFTPMILADAFARSLRARDSEFTTNAADRPLIVQFAANDPYDLAAASLAVTPYADGVDLNCGCPQRWAVSEGYGACLLDKPELVRDMVRQVRAQIPDPNFSVSIKTRVHEDVGRTVELCRRAEASGLSFVTVHGRTAQERHQPVRRDAVRAVSDALAVPVVANGDVRTDEEARRLAADTGASGVMVARGLLTNPALFAGFPDTPLACVRDWLDSALALGVPFCCLHQHLVFMMERLASRADRLSFNSLSSTAAVVDFLAERYGV